VVLKLDDLDKDAQRSSNMSSNVLKRRNFS